ncbi:MAG: hypothetical protein ABI823_10285 [Bryobacteraceae bacterium]
MNSRYLLAVLFAASAVAQPAPERTVEGNRLISKSLPAATIEVAKGFRYLGVRVFPLYGVAIAEMHVFAEPDSAGNVKRFLWFQFEHYTPDNSNTYGYVAERTTTLGPLSFLYDTTLFTDYIARPARPNSDSAEFKGLMEKSGMTGPAATARIRLVHLPGSDRRSELMIIYGEAVGADQLPAGMPNGIQADKNHPEWGARLIKGLLEAVKLTQ